MENGIVKENGQKPLDSIQGLSKIFYESGIFEDVKSEAQAIVKIYAGKEIGLSPLQSMMGLYIVKGQVAATSKVISALIKKSKDYNYLIEKLDNEECILSFTQDGEELGKSVFTIKDAAKAGIVNKDNWKNYPRNCLFARALSNGARWYTPDVYCGYAQEELEELVVEKIPEEVTLEEGKVT